MPQPETETTEPDIAPAVAIPQSVPAKRHRRVWLIVLCLLVLGGLALLLPRRTAARASQHKPGSTPPAVQVAAVAARKGDIGIYVNALGAVTALNTVMVKSRVDGQLIKVDYV